jgi:hypothetical protein
MEIIDAGAMGVRSAVLRLAKRGTPLRFTIYPMIHLAEADFYTEVSSRLREHDLIVAEGMQSPNKNVQRMTQAYRAAGGAERLGLVAQTRAVVEVGVPIIWADMTGEEFDEKWQDVPLVERLIASAGGPLAGLYLRAFGSREFLARYLPIDDDTAVDDWRPESGLDKLVCDEREALLVEELGRIHAERHDGPLDVAIVYGAAHALPVVTYLMAALGYVVIGAEWLTVFDY